MCQRNGKGENKEENNPDSLDACFPDENKERKREKASMNLDYEEVL